jgi:hypothetical protein
MCVLHCIDSGEINTTMSDDTKNPENEINELTEDKNLFDDLGLSVKFGEVEVGQVYPIYGLITEFVSEEPGNVVVKVNDNIQVTMNIEDREKIDVLKNRSFDPGIFVCTITEVDTLIKAECSTVIFGKNNNTIQ